MLDVPHEVVEYVSWLIYARTCELNSRWRRLGCFRQALFALVHLRKNETLAQLGVGFGVSTATAGQALAHPNGTPIWYSRGLPGRTHDLTAARAHGVVQACLSRQILVLADRTYRGAGATVRTPYYGRDLPEKYTQFNHNHARLRAPGERAFARLKQWKIFRKARCSPSRISRTVAAVHAIELAWRSGRESVH